MRLNASFIYDPSCSVQNKSGHSVDMRADEKELLRAGCLIARLERSAIVGGNFNSLG